MDNKYYFYNREKVETYWRTKVMELTKTDTIITDQKMFLKNMDGKASGITINLFLRNSCNKQLRNSKKINNETSLKVIHKILEDVYYNRKHIKKNPINSFSCQTYLEQFIVQIQNFENICIRLEFLDPDYFNRMKDNRVKEKLIMVRNGLVQRKQDIIQQLKTLFTSMFNIL